MRVAGPAVWSIGLLLAGSASAAVTPKDLDRAVFVVQRVAELAARDALHVVSERTVLESCAGALPLAQHSTEIDALAQVRERLGRADDASALDALLERCLQATLPLLGPRADYVSPRRYPLEYGGGRAAIGIHFARHRGAITVVSVLRLGPAERAGLARGDRLTEIDGEPLGDERPGRTLERLVGPVGSKLTLTVIKATGGEPVRLTLQRDLVVEAQAAAATGPDGVLYLAVGSFDSRTLPDLARLLARERASRTVPWRGLVLDLRWSQGGLLDAVTAFALWFLEPTQAMATLERRSPATPEQLDASLLRSSRDVQRVESAMADELRAELRRVPLAAIVGPDSASGAEMIAGALQDHRRARVVGVRTRGTGSIDTVYPLLGAAQGGPSAIRFAVAQAVRPNGDRIEGVGIAPDVALPTPSADDELPLPRLQLPAFAADGRPDEALAAAAWRALKR